MLCLKSLISEVRYDYGCIMAQIPPEVSSLIINFGKEIISDDMLYFDPKEPDDYGREKEPHVTIKFGLTQGYSTQQIQKLLAGTKSFFINIRGMDIFQNKEFDVIKLNVDGPELHRLRSIFDKLPNKDEYKEYHPHLTIAYVKAGLVKKFQNRNNKSFSKVPINIIKYSDRGTPHYFRLIDDKSKIN